MRNSNNNIYKNNIQESSLNYRPSSVVAVISVLVSALLEVEAVNEMVLLVRKVGCLGIGRLTVSLPSKTTTFDIVGCSLGSS